MTPRRAKAYDVETDAEIMTRLARGEIGALGTLYDRHHAPVRRFLVRATSGDDDVDDLLHGVFLTAAKAAATFDGRANGRPWLIGIAVQLVRRRRTALGRLFRVLGSLRDTRSRAVDPRTVLDARTDLDKALARLTEAKRLTLLLAEVEGLSCAEIAELLAIPIGTVWTRLHAARNEMRAALEGP